MVIGVAEMDKIIAPISGCSNGENTSTGAIDLMAFIALVLICFFACMEYLLHYLRNMESASDGFSICETNEHDQQYNDIEYQRSLPRGEAFELKFQIRMKKVPLLILRHSIHMT